MSKELKLLIREDLVTKSGKTRIEFLIYFEGKQYRVATGQSIKPKFWIQKSELVDKKSDDATKINSYLSERRQEFEKYKRKKEALEENVSLEEMKRILKETPLEEAKDKENKLIYLTNSESFDNYVKYQKMKLGSKNNHRITKNVLVNFCESKYKKDVIRALQNQSVDLFRRKVL
jgi:hypothetical protein